MTRPSPWPWLALIALIAGGVVAWRSTQPVVPIEGVLGWPTAPSLPLSTPFAGTALPLLVIVATEAPPTATATRRPLPTYTPLPVCWPGPGTATPAVGQTCYQPLLPIVPATERPSPTCTALATPGTLCVWEGP